MDVTRGRLVKPAFMDDDSASHENIQNRKDYFIAMNVKASKFMSLVLRHKPEIIGLVLDSGGWADIAKLSEKAAQAGVRLTRQLIFRIVAESDKQRFTISDDGLRIRANHGHSAEVDLGLQPSSPPESLYHGTARQMINSIKANGILPGRRQMVHLSSDPDAAVAVGRRHGSPAVLLVHARKMEQVGFIFYRSASGVWLTPHVPTEYLQVIQ